MSLRIPALAASLLFASPALADDAVWTAQSDMIGHSYVSTAGELVQGWSHEGGSYYKETSTMVTAFRKGDLLAFAVEKHKGNAPDGRTLSEIMTFQALAGMTAGNYPQHICEMAGLPKNSVVVAISDTTQPAEDAEVVPIIAALKVDLVSGAMTPVPVAAVTCPFFMP